MSSQHGGKALRTPGCVSLNFHAQQTGPFVLKVSSESLLLLLYEIPVTLDWFYCTKQDLAKVALL